MYCLDSAADEEAIEGAPPACAATNTYRKRSTSTAMATSTLQSARAKKAKMSALPAVTTWLPKLGDQATVALRDLADHSPINFVYAILEARVA
jgi:hypothetical protein